MPGPPWRSPAGTPAGRKRRRGTWVPRRRHGRAGRGRRRARGGPRVRRARGARRPGEQRRDRHADGQSAVPHRSAAVLGGLSGRVPRPGGDQPDRLLPGGARRRAPAAVGRGRVVNVSMNHSTMNRRGFVPYGPARAGAEALARIMAADLAGTGVTANILLPGGATATGMIPDDFPPAQRAHLLDPAVMGPPIRWLCSPQAAGVHDQRIVASEFTEWLAAHTA